MKIIRESQFQPFGGSMRYEGEGNAEYKIRLLKEKANLEIKLDKLTSEYSCVQKKVYELKNAAESTSSILDYIDNELKSLR